MARITQLNIFSWREIEDLGDLERLQLIINHFPDEKLMQILEKERSKGRNDYPIRCVWNSILAGIVYQHNSIESLRRELLRNAQLRELCGFDPLLGSKAIPPSYIYSRFFKTLFSHAKLIDEIFNFLVSELSKLLPDFGKIIAGDGKAINSFASKSPSSKKRDGKRDVDADYGVKTYRGIKEDGSLWEKTKIWFGYRLHLLVDAKYELPLAYKTTKASKSESKVMKKVISKYSKKHKNLIAQCDYALFDKGYDDKKLIKTLWENYNIKPIIDIRNMWKDKDKTRLLPNSKNIVYDFKGSVYCHCMTSGNVHSMAYGGFEKARQTLKYRCPARHYGLKCQYKQCAHKGGIRIPLKFDKRIFIPLARSSYKWKTLYKKRTTVERVNSRLDVSFGFENHTIRGLKKMNLRVGLALCVMLTMALGRVKEKRKDLIRSLVRAA